MSITKLENAIYAAEDWQDEIVSKDLLKIGHLKIEWEISGDDILVKTDSAIDVSGNIYLIDADETITGPVTDRFITFNGTTFSTSDVDLLFNNDKNGYYLDGTNTRIIGYFDGTAMQSINKDVGYLNELNADTINADNGLTGNLTGNVDGNLTGNVTGNLTGNVSGNLSGYITGGFKYAGGGGSTFTMSTPGNHTLGTDGNGLYLVSLGESFSFGSTILIPAGQEIYYASGAYSYRKFG